MLKKLKVTFAALAILFAGAQLVRPERTNPPTVAAETLEAHLPVTPEVGALLERSCNDCHSHRTRWPWYSNVAPVSWFVVDHVDHGRRHLNFSRWSAYEPEDADQLLDGVCREARGGMMPLSSYTRMHHAAQLSAADVRALCDWTAAARRHLTTQ